MYLKMDRKQGIVKSVVGEFSLQKGSDPMIDAFVNKIAEGMIFSVDWHGIREMLGEEEGRSHTCTILPNADTFPLQPQETATFSETDIKVIISRSHIKWMRETYEEGNPLYPITARFFSAVEPRSEQWLKIPM